MRADERDEQMTAVALADAAEDGTGRPTAAMPSGDPRQSCRRRPSRSSPPPRRLLVARRVLRPHAARHRGRVGCRLGDGAVLLREQGRPRRGDDRLGLSRRPGRRPRRPWSRCRARTVCTASSTACARSARRARSASFSISCPRPAQRRGSTTAWLAPTTGTGVKRNWLRADVEPSPREAGGPARRGRARHRGRRRSGHPGGDRRRLRPRPRRTLCSSSCCSARCRS